MSKSIRVTMVAYPDGSSIYLKDATREQIDIANKAWRASLSPERKAAHWAAATMGGAIVLTMLEDDYNALGTSNHPALVALGKSGIYHDG